MSTPTAHIVSLGAASAPAAERVAAIAAVLSAAGLAVGAQVFVEEDEAALERALALTHTLAVIVAAPGRAAGGPVRRVLARLTGTHLVPAGPRRDDGSLPQGAILWSAPDDEPAWALECGERAFVVLSAGARIDRLLERHLPSLVRAHGRGGAGRTLKTAGVSLPDLEARLREWLGAGGDVAVSTVAVDGETWVRLCARGATAAAAADVLAAQEAKILARLGADCYGRDAETLEQVLGRLLLERALTVSVAESCTGGLVGHRLTNVPGSSAYFERGVVVYSNRAKQELLGVPEAMLRTHGAVSAPTAEAMARGIRAASGSGCALAITGIAGPDGGTPTKPVGTVFIGVAVGDEVRAHRFVFPGDRAAVKWQSAQTALDLLRRRVLGEPVRG